MRIFDIFNSARKPGICHICCPTAFEIVFFFTVSSCEGLPFRPGRCPPQAENTFYIPKRITTILPSSTLPRAAARRQATDPYGSPAIKKGFIASHSENDKPSCKELG